MTRPDNDHFFSRIGAVTFPVEGDQVTDEQLFSVLDPLRDRLLRFFCAVINKELGQGIDSVEPTSVWAVCRANTQLAGKKPVEDTLYTQPTPTLVLSSEYKFPLLAVYREGSAGDNKWSLDIERINSRWGVDYIVGPLDPADHRRLSAAVDGAHMAIMLALRLRRHPAYQEGADQFPEEEIWRLSAASSDVGPATFGEAGKGQEFYALHITLEGEELIDFDTTVYPDHEGTSVNVGLGGSEGILPDVMQARAPGGPPMPPTMG